MGDAMCDKDGVCKGCYYEERSYTVAPCNECSRAFSGMQRDWYMTEQWDSTIFCPTCLNHTNKCVECRSAPLIDHGIDSLPLYWRSNLALTKARVQPVSDSRIGNDVVKHPKHYKLCNTEVIDIIHSALTEEQFKGYILGNVMKYRMRAGKKGDTLEDIHKAIEYEEMWGRYYD